MRGVVMEGWDQEMETFWDGEIERQRYREVERNNEQTERRERERERGNTRCIEVKNWKRQRGG
jgi:hypothetical protein